MIEAVTDDNLIKESPSTAGRADVSVVIVSYNVAGLLKACLDSLQQRADALEVEIVVVDNASSDESAALVARDYPNVKLVANQENVGFPRGCNQGWRASNGRYVFFLNPDATITPNTVQKLVDFLEDEPQVGLVGPRVTFPDGRVQSTRRRWGGPLLPLVESTILQYQTPLHRLPMLRKFYCEDLPADQTQPVDWLVGAAFMTRRDLLEKLGGLDERFFMYSEEVDFCRRVRWLGRQVWFVADAHVTHQEGQSSRQNLAARAINFNTSKIAYYRKYYGNVYAGGLQSFLLGTQLIEYAEEWAKLRLGHKPDVRRERLTVLRQVLASGFRPYHRATLTKEELVVCLLSAEFYPQAGGLGDYTARLAQALTAKGVATQILTGQSNRPPTPTLPGPKRWNWLSLGEVTRIFNWRHSDIVNIQYQTGAYRMHPAVNWLPLFLRARLGIYRPKVVTTFHDLLLPYLFPKAGRVRRWVTQLLLRTSDAAIVTNEADHRQALAWGVRPDRLHLVPIGANIEPTESTPDRATTRAELGLAPTDFAVGYFGLVNQSKGLDTLLEAFAHLPGQDWKLVIVGGETGETDRTNQPYAAQLEDLIARSGLTSRIIRTGHRAPAQTSALLEALDGAALPFRDGASFRRGSLLATLAHGLPVVTTYPTGLLAAVGPQLIDGQNVIMIEPGNPAALSAALERLQADPKLRHKLGAGAKELAAHFSWDTIADHLIEIYLKLAN